MATKHMRGTIFKHPTNVLHYAQVDPNKTDEEIYEIEKDLIENGWEPIPSHEEYMRHSLNYCPNCGQKLTSP